MASLGLHLLTVILGLLFMFLGHVKLTPQFFPDYHNQVRNEFGKLNKEFPFYQQTGWRPYAKSYRIAVGVAEMTAGTLLLLGGASFQSISTMVLLIIMTNFVIAFQRLQYPVEYLAAGLFVSALLVVRLLVGSKSGGKPTAKAQKNKKEEKVE